MKFFDGCLQIGSQHGQTLAGRSNFFHRGGLLFRGGGNGLGLCRRMFAGRINFLDGD